MLKDFKQSHFTLYELVLPYCTICTPVEDANGQWHTPVTCEESSDSEYSLWFSKNNVPVTSPPERSIDGLSVLNGSVFRYVKSATESTPMLKAGLGMASRGTLTLTFSDESGDPGPINFSESGTFFGKLRARNILYGKKIISHHYTLLDNSDEPIEIGTSIHFITDSNLSNGTFKISAKDALKDIERFSSRFPEPTESKLSSDINESQTSFDVTDGSLYSENDVVIIDKELMLINSVSGNTIVVYPRGSTYEADDRFIYKTRVDNHSIDSTVQKCYVMNKRFLSLVLQDIFNEVGLSEYVNFSQWDSEISEWNSNAFLYGVIHEPTSADDLIDKMLSDYMIDMWLDQNTQKCIVSATTIWKQARRTITEDSDIQDLKIKTSDEARFSRAYIYHTKEYQSENDDTTNYSQISIHKDTETETGDFYGSVKIKEYDPSGYITSDSAQILTSRFVQRYSIAPSEVTGTMEERKLSGTKLGDVVDIIARDSQTPSGEYIQSKIRSQILEMKPDYNGNGRRYKIKALSYVPLLSPDAGNQLTIFISGNVFNLNLFARAGAPPDPINITYVMQDVVIGSTSKDIPSIRAGSFALGSTIKIIFTGNSSTGNGGTQSIGGYINGSASFSGNGYISGLPTVQNTSGEFSVSMWFNTTVNPSVQHTMLGGIKEQGTNDSVFALKMLNDGYSKLYLRGTDGTLHILADTVDAADGNWHHLVGTVSSSSGVFYVDGQQVDSATISNNITVDNLLIGAENNRATLSPTNYFNGSIDQVRIYNVALSSSDVTALYSETAATATTAAFPSGQTAIATYTMDTSANGLLNTQDLSTVDYPSGAGCIALYEMNGNSNDTSGSYTGTPNNITYQSGAFNEAIQYSGASSNIETNIANSNFTSNYSISFWVNLDNANTFQNFVGNYQNSPYGGFTFMSRDVGGGVYRFGFIWWYNSGAFYNYVDNNDVVATSGQWAHLVVTKSSSALPILYVNGTANSLNYRNAVTDHGTTSQNFKIGNTLNTNYSAGLTDQVRIFNTALTQSQVTTLARGIATSYSGTSYKCKL